MLTLVALTAVSNDVKAQSSIGIKGGYSASTLRGDDVGDIDWRSGFAGGLFINVPFLKILSVQPEVLFRQRGATNRNETFNINQRIKLTYMDVPILFKLRLPINETFYPHVYIGPQFSYNIQGKYEVEAFDGVTVEDDIDVQKVDAGGVMGFGLDVQMNRLFFTADFRYGLGGVNIDRSDNQPFLLKNKDLAIMVGVGINLGSKD